MSDHKPAKYQDSGGGDSISEDNIDRTWSMVSEREGKTTEVDQALEVFRRVNEEYGYVIDDIRVATLNGGAKYQVMAFYSHNLMDDSNYIAVNDRYFSADQVGKAYDACVESGFHPGRGDKTAMEALVAHELGHALTHAAGLNAGKKGALVSDRTAEEIIERACRRHGKYYGARGQNRFTEAVSGYAGTSRSEAIAEAFADVYCNGSNAKSESRAIVSVLNGYFGK